MKPPLLLALFCAHLFFGVSALLAAPPAVALTANATTIPRYDIYELTMVNNGVAYTNAFSEVTINAVFTAPSGKTYTVGGFCYDFDVTNKINTYKVRFASREVGNWTWSLTFTNSGGQYATTGSFACTASTSTGFLRQSPQNPGRFITEADGKTFYINGYAIGYTNSGNDPIYGGVEANGVRLPVVDVLKTYQRSGMNLYRCNMQSMTAHLKGYPSNVSFDTALLKWQDQLVEGVHNSGMKFLLCFNASLLGTYNFSNPSELAGTLAVHKYWINRYGAYVDMWELGNEMGGMTQTYIDTITAFCAENDPYRHPVTVSFQQWRPYLQSWIDESALNAANLHVYSGATNLDLDKGIVQTAYNSNGLVGLRALRSHYPNVPLFSGEQGNGTPYASYDPERYRIHLWTDITNEGGPVFWLAIFSKTYVNTLSNLYIGSEERSMARVESNLVSGLDPLVVSVPATVGTNLRGYVMGSSQNLIGYFLHTNSHTTYLSGGQVTLSIPMDGMLGQWVDPRSGNILKNFVVNSGTQTLPLPDFLCDVVLRVRPPSAAPILEFTSASFPAQENQGSVTVTATRANNSSGAVSVNYSTSDGQSLAGTDYTAANGTLTWADGDMAPKKFTVPLQDNGVDDNDKDFRIFLTSPTGGAALGGNDNALVTVYDAATTGGGQPAIYVTRSGGLVSYESIDNVSGAVAGTPTAVTYQVANTGTAALNLGTPVLGTPVNCSASVATAPAASVPAGGSTILVLTITPTGAGAWSCPFSFTTNDQNVVYDVLNASPTHTYRITPGGTALKTGGPEIAVMRGGSAVADGGTDAVSGTKAGSATALSYVIANLGSSDLTNGTPSVSSFVNCTATVTTAPAASVASGGATTLGLNITPAASGAWSCAVSFATNDSDENPTNWTASGTAVTSAEPEITVFRGFEVLKGAVESINNTRTGAPIAITYEIRNTGSGPLTLGAPTFGTKVNCTASITTAPASSVPAGASTSLTVTATPTATGTWSCPISMVTNDSDENPMTWTPGGSGLAAPIFNLTHSNIPITNFGTDPIPNTRAGSSFVLNYVIANTGNANLTLTAPTFGFLANCTASVTTTPATTVAPGGSTTLDVTVTPSGTSTWACPLNMTSNDNNVSGTADRWTARGSVDAAAGAEVDVTRSGIAIVDGAIDYGNGGVAGSPGVVTYQIANIGTAALTVGTPAVSSLVNCTAVLTIAPASSVAAGASTPLKLTVTPTIAGTWFATVSFATNDSNENPTDWTVGGSATPAPPSLVFKSATYSKTEGNTGTSTATITVSRTGNSAGAVGVSYATADATATAGSDYAAASGTLSWADGDTADKTFAVTINGDTAYEPDETVILSLANPTGGAILGTPASAVLTILNDDAAPQLYAAWASSYGLSGANALDSASPAGDGVSNLIKYALGLNPTQPATVPTDGTVPGLPRGFLEGANVCLLYQKDTAKTDLTYAVQASTDLQSWGVGGVTETVQSTTGSIQTIKASVPKGSDARKVLRLQITRQSSGQSRPAQVRAARSP